MLMVTIGLGVRAVIDSPPVFLALSVLALLGMGIGNVVLPPLVKSYFPDRVALMSTVHVGLLQFGTFIPPLVAVPLDRKSTRLNSSHVAISYAVFCLKKKKA